MHKIPIQTHIFKNEKNDFMLINYQSHSLIKYTNIFSNNTFHVLTWKHRESINQIILLVHAYQFFL
jgi:hypothetical protein